MNNTLLTIEQEFKYIADMVTAYEQWDKAGFKTGDAADDWFEYRYQAKSNLNYDIQTAEWNRDTKLEI